MKYIVTIMLVLLLTACGGATTAPTEIEQVRTALEHSLRVLQTGIDREDAVLASQIIGERFVMGNNVAVRYLDDGWTGTGIGSFRDFFNQVFAVHSNLSQTFEPADLTQVGDVATFRVHNDLLSSRVDRMPPENYTATGWDWMVFERSSGQWLLIGWDEAPDPSTEHNAGEGGGD